MSEPQAPNPKRRDWLFTATKIMGGVVVGAAVWPLIRATGTTADIEEQVMRVAVDLLEPGT